MGTTIKPKSTLRKISNLTANEARELYNKLDTNELYDVLSKIYDEASNKKTQALIRYSLHKSTIDELKSRGFNVKFCNSMEIMEIQVEGVYYRITWF